MFRRKNKVEKNDEDGNDVSKEADKPKSIESDKFSSLPKWEVYCCIVLWFFFYGFAVAQIFFISKANKHKYYAKGYLENGWISFLKTYKDITDYEWSFWNQWLWKVVIQGFSGHFLVARLADIIFPQHRFKIAAAYGIAFCYYIFGWVGPVFMTSHFIIQYSVAAVTKRTYCCWISAACLIYTLTNRTCIMFTKSFFEDKNTAYILLFSTAMCNLRYIAFSLEYVWEIKRRQEANNKKDDGKESSERETTKEMPISFMHLLMYEFYFPLCFGGPVLNYNKFCEQLDKPPVVWDRSVTLKFLIGVVRFAFWQFFIEFALHFMYFNTLQYEYHIVKRMPMLALCGLALCMVQFFCMKYVVMYGFPSHFATADNLIVPAGPHCVSAKYRFTDMWRYFDKGLHKWLVRYIFIPIGGSKNGFVRNFLASVLPFSFVYYWHGARVSQLYWASLNWFGVYVETVTSQLSKTEQYQKVFGRLSGPMQRRLHGFLSCGLFSLLIVSNLYFLSGTTGGNIYMQRVYTENILSTFLVHVVLYCGIQTSIEFTQRFNV